MPATAASRKPPAEIDKTATRRFPLVHKLIHFADLRHFYRDMREALITANRRAGAQQGLVTKAKRKIAQLEAELSLLEKERADLLAYRQQVRQIEQALANLSDVKEAVAQQSRTMRWSSLRRPSKTSNPRSNPISNPTLLPAPFPIPIAEPNLLGLR